MKGGSEEKHVTLAPKVSVQGALLELKDSNILESSIEPSLTDYIYVKGGRWNFLLRPTKN